MMLSAIDGTSARGLPAEFPTCFIAASCPESMRRSTALALSETPSGYGAYFGRYNGLRHFKLQVRKLTRRWHLEGMSISQFFMPDEAGNVLVFALRVMVRRGRCSVYMRADVPAAE